MKFSKKLIAIIVSVVAISLVAVMLMLPTSAETSGYYTYTVTGTNATITDVDTNISGDVVVPLKIGGYRVTAIADNAFAFCNRITNVELSPSIQSIGKFAFTGCSSLESILIPDSVVSIGDNAFSGCSKLTSIEIPAAATTLGSNMFSGCAALENITIKDGNAKYYSEGNCIIETETKTLLSGCNNSTIPSDVTAIADGAFFGCASLTDVVIPAGVESIGNYAFSGCRSITKIAIPASVTTIGEEAFYDCRALESITVASSNVNYAASNNCLIEKATNTLILGCKNSTIPSDGSVTVIGSNAFANCYGLTSVVIPEGVTEIGSYAFFNCKGLESVTIPQSVTVIGDGAFSGSVGLKELYISKNVTKIGEAAFHNSAEDVFYAGTAEEWMAIDQNAWSDYNTYTLHFDDLEYVLTSDRTAYRVTGIGNLSSKDLVIPSMHQGLPVTSIDAGAFFGCKTIESIKIPASITSIGTYAFYGCSGLTAITVDEGNTVYRSVGNCLVDIASKTIILGCKASTIPVRDAGVTDIGVGAFAYCDVETITIPYGIYNIAAYAFYGCDDLTTLTISNQVKTIGVEAFSGCSALTGTLNIPNSVTSIEALAFYNCGGVTTLKIGSKTASIGSNAFLGCSGLKTITVLASNTTYKSLNNCLIETASNTLILGSNGATIDSSVTSIKENAFSGCAGLTRITIPASVKTIGDGAFENCTGLTAVTINSGVTSIGEEAFAGCTALTSVSIPNSVTALGDSVFSGCSSLASVTIGTGVKTVPHSAFAYCTNLESVTVPNTVTDLGAAAFFGSGIKNVTLSNNIKMIRYGTFAACQNLDHVSVPTSVGNIEFGAFAGSGLESVEIQSYTHTDVSKTFKNIIGSYVFYGCNQLDNIYFLGTQANWNSIEKNANWQFGADDAVVRFNVYTFTQSGSTYIITGMNDSTATVIAIPPTYRGLPVTAVKASAFASNTKVTNVVIPDSVKTINASAFNAAVTRIDYLGTQAEWNTVTKGNSAIPASATVYYNYIVTFNDEDGTVISSLEYHDGDTVVVPAAPEKAADDTFIYIFDGWDNEVATVCASDATYNATYALKLISVTFQRSMQAYLNLESVVTMSVGYKIEGMENITDKVLLDDFGLLIWSAADAPDEANAIYSNCDYIVNGAVYNAALGRFESTTLGIAAKELGDQLTFRAYYRNADGSYSYGRVISNYSPKTYCYNQIKNNSGDTKLINLMSSILNYGAAAQVHFGHNTSTLMNADLAEDLKLMNWDGSLVRSNYNVPAGKDSAFVRSSAVTSRGGYLNLQGAVDYNYYAKVNFTPAKATIYYWTESDIANLDALTLENATSSEAMTWNAASSRWEGKYEGQAAKEMFNTVFACMAFEDADGNVVYSGVVGYSPERYAYLNQNKGDTNAELAKRLVVYGDAARTFFGK